MNDLQKIYIKNQILTMPIKLNQELTYKNRKFNKCLNYEKIINYVDNFLMGDNSNRFLVLSGLHDVGKTTILLQVYDYLVKEKCINPKNILYFSCNLLKRTGNADIFDVINYYSETYHNSIIETLSQPIFILIDDAQYDNDWAFNGKLIYDSSKNIFMIFSGSSALKLSYNPDAARRLLNIPVYLLTYSQHLKLKYENYENTISNSIIDLIFDGNIQNTMDLDKEMINIYSNFKNYDVSEWKNFLQFGGFPSSFYQEKDDITKKINDMVDKVVMSDMNNIEGINNETQYLAFQILNHIAFKNPCAISKASLSNRFDAKIALVTKVLDILEKTQLIFHIEPFTSSVKRTTKPNEYFFCNIQFET